MAFTNFAALLRQEAASGADVPGAVLAARAFLSLNLAAFAFPQLRFFGERHGSIVVIPGAAGTVVFDTPAIAGVDGGPVSVRIAPGNFDLKWKEQAGEFIAYRAFLDEVRRLPPTPGEESTTEVEAFEIHTSNEDMAKWGEIWALWENAHGI